KYLSVSALHNLPAVVIVLFFSLSHPPPNSRLFPYTTLFRSWDDQVEQQARVKSDEQGNANEEHCAEPFGNRDGWPRRMRIWRGGDRKSTRLNSSHEWISYAVFCLKKKNLDALVVCLPGGQNS